MTIFDFDDYKRYFRFYISRLPKKGHGQITRMAEYLNVNPTLLSQILSGPKDFTLEQSFELCKYMGLSSIESDFLLLLIEKERAGSKNLQNYFQGKLLALKEQGAKLAAHVVQDHKMDDTTRAVYYSTWMYSALRLLTSIEDFQSADAIAKRLGITRAAAVQMLRFLVDHQLCLEKDGRYTAGPQRTYLEPGSPFIGRHHLNWRMKAMQKVDTLTEQEMMFTSPLAISREDFEAIRKDLSAMIQKALGRVKESKSESLFCLNVDFFEIL